MPQLQTVIVGAQWVADGDAILATSKLVGGETITLKRDPTNPEDTNAVQCWVGGQHIGFIPARQNPDIARALDADPDCAKAHVTEKADVTAIKVRRPAKMLVTW